MLEIKDPEKIKLIYDYYDSCRSCSINYYEGRYYVFYYIPEHDFVDVKRFDNLSLAEYSAQSYMDGF